MKNGIQASTGIIIASIYTLILTWITFFSRLCDGQAYFWAMGITIVCGWMVCLCLVDDSEW